jgi:hypothetical protein
MLPAMGNGPTETGYRNRNRQIVVRPTHLAGTDHNHYVYVKRCGDCGHEYGPTVRTSSGAGAPTVKAVLQDFPLG